VSRRARIGWALALIAALVASGAWLVLPDEEPAHAPTAEPRSVESRDLPARAFEAAAESASRQERRRALAEHPEDEPGPGPATLRLYERTRREAEPVARAFHAAFSRYELGEGDAAALRATAMPELARELLASPPRPLPGVERRAPARLGRLELVPLAGDRSRRMLTTVELVGTVRRGDRRDPIAFELRWQEGRWLVEGLGL